MRTPTGPTPARARTVALLLAGLLGLGGCTWGGASPSGSAIPSPAPEPEPLRTTTSAPGAPLTVLGEPTDVEASLRASRELFDASGAAVVVATGRPDVQRLAGHAAVAMGVPLLVGSAPTAGDAGTPDPALADELDRLGVRTVVVVDDVAGFASADAAASDDDTADEDTADEDPDDERVVVRSEPTPAALSAATGLAIAPSDATDPAAFTGEVAALAPGAPTGASVPDDDAAPEPSPSRTDGPTDGATDGPTDASADGAERRDDAPDLTAVERDAELTDVVAVAADDPAQLAAVATARAAGVPVHLVPAAAPNPQAHAGVVDALATSPATDVLAIGAALAAEPALDWKIRSSRTGYQLPGGGQLLFPRHQFIALYGSPVTSALGLLGEQDVTGAVQRAQATAAQYAGLSDRTVVPMFEMIATVAAGQAGADGNYSNEQPVEVLRPWVEAAGQAGISVVLDLQPGRADFLTQAQQYEELLRMPHVGLALDPEWRLGPQERPLQRIGSVGAAEVNSVVHWLADLTRDNALPPKMFVLHQFRLDMLPDREAIDMTRPELAMVIHADGQGSQPAKQSTWQTLRRDAPAGVAWGWKNFIDEDLPMLTPEQTVSGVSPLPDLVTYQ